MFEQIYQSGDLVRVRGHSQIEESDVVRIEMFDSSDNTYQVLGKDVGPHWVNYDDIDLVRSAADVDAQANSLPSPKFKDGDRVRHVYAGVMYIVNNFYDRDCDDNIIVETNDPKFTHVAEKDLEPAPLPELPWSDVEDIIREKFAALWKETIDRDISGNRNFEISCYGWGDPGPLKFNVSIGGASMEGGSLDKTFDEVMRRYFENESNKPKALPKR